MPAQSRFPRKHIFIFIQLLIPAKIKRPITIVTTGLSRAFLSAIRMMREKLNPVFDLIECRAVLSGFNGRLIKIPAIAEIKYVNVINDEASIVP